MNTRPPPSITTRSLPKTELHCHLEGCFRPATVREVGRALGIEVPADDATFRRDWLITEPMTNLAVALGKFANIQSIWASEEVIERMTCEAIEDCRAQNIRLLELRYSPDFIAEGHPRLTFEKIHGAIVRGVERARHPDIAVGLIGIVRKILSYREAAHTTAFIIENRATFVGLDFADRDIGYEMRRFAPLLEKSRGAGLHLTLHCAENDIAQAPDQVRMAIEELGAERIGHGIFAARDPSVLAFARKRNVLFELCPTSNWLTSSVRAIREHPIRKFMQAGVPVSINSDDPSLFGIDLTHEYDLLARELAFTEADFAACNAHGVAHSFIPEKEKRRVWTPPGEVSPGAAVMSRLGKANAARAD